MLPRDKLARYYGEELVQLKNKFQNDTEYTTSCYPTCSLTHSTWLNSSTSSRSKSFLFFSLSRSLTQCCCRPWRVSLVSSSTQTSRGCMCDQGRRDLRLLRLQRVVVCVVVEQVSLSSRVDRSSYMWGEKRMLFLGQSKAVAATSSQPLGRRRTFDLLVGGRREDRSFSDLVTCMSERKPCLPSPLRV